MDTQMRRIYRQMAAGDYSNIQRYHRWLLRCHANETEPRLRATDMERECLATQMTPRAASIVFKNACCDGDCLATRVRRKLNTATAKLSAMWKVA